MYRKPEDVDDVATELVNALLSASMVSPSEAPAIFRHIQTVFAKEQELEDELERKTQSLMQQYAGAMSREAMDRQSVHMRIRKKLAKDMGLVL